jgi:cobalt-zinc-cadmium efflux system outer membrane protein
MRIAWFAIFIVIRAAPLIAQTPAQTSRRVFRLDELETLALAANPAMGEAAAQVRAVRGRARQAGLYPNPVLGATGDHNTPAFSGGGLGGFAEQRIVTGGKLGLSRRAADAETAVATESHAATRLRVLTEIRQLYYRGLAEQRLMDVRKEMADTAARTAATLGELNNVGQADLPDQMEAEIEAQRASLAVTMAENALTRTWREIAAAVNQPTLAPGVFDGDAEAVPALNAETTLARIMSESPELREAQAEAERAAALVKRARVENIPDVTVRGGVRYNREPIFEPGHAPAIVGNEGFFDVGVEIPLFNRNQGNVSAAVAGAEQARLEVDRRRAELRIRFAAEFKEFSDATAALDRLKRDMLPRARQALDLYRANFRQMSTAYMQILTAERNLIQLEEDYAAQLISAWRSAVEIEGLLVDDMVDGMGTPRGRMLN